MKMTKEMKKKYPELTEKRLKIMWALTIASMVIGTALIILMLGRVI